jgi:hypothetical protein
MLFSATDGPGEAIDEAPTAWAGSFVDDWKRKNQAPIPAKTKIIAAIPTRRIAFDFPADVSVDVAAFIPSRGGLNLSGSFALPHSSE